MSGLKAQVASLPARLARPALLMWLPVIALMALSVWSTLRFGVPGDIDAPNHFYRFVELDWHVRNGDYYPRWFADVFYGFGGPVLNFYAPLSYYLLVAIRVVVTSFGQAFILGFAFSFVVAIGGAYIWVSDQFGSRLAGLTAAAAYGLAPYLYYTLFKRGSYPELWGLALAPWLFWAVRRSIRQPSWKNRVLVTLCYAVLLLTHNLSLLLFTPLVLLYALQEYWTTHGSDIRRWIGFARLAFYLANGLAIGAILLVPFFIESGSVQLQRATVLSYRDNFLPFDQMFSRPVAFDPYYIQYLPQPSLAWPPAILALAAVAAVFAPGSKSRSLRRPVGVLAALLVVLIFFMHPISLPVWDAVPLAKLVQFPWRLAGPASLLLAWLSGAAVALVPRSTWRLALAAGAAAAIFLFSLSWTYGLTQQFFSDAATPRELNEFERSDHASAGTTGTQEFLPVWVAAQPDSQALADGYQQTLMPSRLAPVPPGVAVEAVEQHLTTTVVAYNSSRPFSVTVNQFYFPGWAATVDGQPAVIGPSTPAGLVTVAVPAGSHQLRVFRQLTLPESAGTWISVLALILVFIPWPNGTGQPGVSDSSLERSGAESTASALAMTILIAGLLLFRAAVVDQTDTIFRHTERFSIPNSTSVKFADQLELLGYSLAGGGQPVSGGQYPVTLYWTTAQRLGTRYSTSLQLVDAAGNRFGVSDNYQPGDLPTSWWPPEHYARDVHQLQILPGTPPGKYHFRVSVYSGESPGSFTPLPLAGNAGLDYDLTEVSVQPGPPQGPGPLRLITASLAARDTNVGDRLAFSATWNTGSAPAAGLRLRFVLAGASGQSLFASELPPAGPDLPSENWPANVDLLYPSSVILPANLPAGPVQASISMLDASGRAVTPALVLGTVNIHVPERSFMLPPIQHRADYDFGGTIRLLGYDLQGAETILYWQALGQVSTPLTVFIHRFGPDGAFVAGQDSPPARSVTSWLPGEIITDAHPFAAGDRFEIGLYDPVSGQRLDGLYQVRP